MSVVYICDVCHKEEEVSGAVDSDWTDATFNNCGDKLGVDHFHLEFCKDCFKHLKEYLISSGVTEGLMA